MMRLLREDVHVHAAADAVYTLVREPEHRARWFGPAVAELAQAGDALVFRLPLPLRSERAQLVLAADEAPRLLTYAANGVPTAVGAVTWVLRAEGPAEVHVSMEAGYTPASGPLGWLLEEVLHRPHRRQALRDSLWRLKLIAEGAR
ncbi:MAG: hypothetical protein EXR63_05605 [Dehalococcoidia bacterium]|nr:hypothetical protein [Dehalococcoidia bacterium]